MMAMVTPMRMSTMMSMMTPMRMSTMVAMMTRVGVSTMMLVRIPMIALEIVSGGQCLLKNTRRCHEAPCLRVLLGTRRSFFFWSRSMRTLSTCYTVQYM